MASGWSHACATKGVARQIGATRSVPCHPLGCPGLGELEEVNARAAKKTLAVQAARRMKQLGLTTTALAARMHTSRNQVHRILDERDAGITLKMLFRLASALDLSLRLVLGAPLRGASGGARKRRPAALARRASGAVA